MQVRIRWTDLLRFRQPRIVIDGHMATSAQSRRILRLAQRKGKFNDMWQWLCLYLLFPLTIFAVTSTMVIGDFLRSFFNLQEWWINVLVSIPLYIVAALPGLFALVVVAYVLLKPELSTALRIMAEKSCVFCGYDVRGHEQATVCPECGNQRYA